MSIENTYPTYDSLDHALKQQSVALTAAPKRGSTTAIRWSANLVLRLTLVVA